MGDVSIAAIKVTVSEENLISEGEGNGPVNVPDPRAAQGSRKYQIYQRAQSHRLRVLIPDVDTEAVARVLIESEDENGEHCTRLWYRPISSMLRSRR